VVNQKLPGHSDYGFRGTSDRRDEVIEMTFIAKKRPIDVNRFADVFRISHTI